MPGEGICWVVGCAWGKGGGWGGLAAPSDVGFEREGEGVVGLSGSGGAGCRDCWGRRLLLLLLLLLLFLGGGGGWERRGGGAGCARRGAMWKGGRRLRPRRGHEVRAVGEASLLFLIKETTFIER